MKRIPINEAIINIDQEPPESVYAWYYYQKFISYFDKNFTEWTAYKLGIIDKNGEILKIPKTNIEKSALNAIANLVRKLKVHMKKHSSDSIIKIISYYLKYGFRTTSQALIESYAEDELKVVERVLKMDKHNKFRIDEMKQSFTIKESIDFKDTVGISFIQQFTKDVTITVNPDKFKELIKDFFNYEDILIEIESFARYTILSEKNAEKKTYDVFNFPKLINIRYEGKKIGSIIFRVISTESIEINYDIVDDSFDVEFEAMKTYFDETKDYYSIIYDVSDVLKSDVFASKLIIYYAGSNNIDFFSAIQKGDRLVIDAMDELVAKEFIDMMGESYSITISKDENKGEDQDVQPEPNEKPEDISGESTAAATALTSYAPPLGKTKKRKNLNEI